MDLKQEILLWFTQGDMTLEERAYAEKAYAHLLSEINRQSKLNDYIPEYIQKLDDQLIDMYFCNFSLFQSLPDSWAINQLFPIMPIHKLNEPCSKKGFIVDVTCDSDGEIKKFGYPSKTMSSIPLHKFNEKSPYYLGIFLVGAYQEVLGGLHNLFGDTNAIHVDFDEKGNWEFKHEIEGDTIQEVLHYAQYNTEALNEKLRFLIERALKSNKISYPESSLIKKRFKELLGSYTYLVV